MGNYIQFIGNQGSEQVLAFYLGMAEELERQVYDSKLAPVYTVWFYADRDWLVGRGVDAARVACFEDFVAARGLVDVEFEVDYLNRFYPEVKWCAAIASERSFTDYSMLLGGAGHRLEEPEYIIRLLSNLVHFFEEAYATHPPLAVVTQTADTLISYVAIKVAQHNGLPVRSIVPAWFHLPEGEGGFFACDEFMHCRAMQSHYTELCKGRELSREQLFRVNCLKDAIIKFDGTTSYYKSNNRGIARTITPNLNRLVSYVKQNLSLNKDFAYTRFSVQKKIWANLIRQWRKFQARDMLGSTQLSLIPEKSVFFAMHMQPEQSTLTQGVWHINQIALIENISKALPIGFTLIVKEHPINRGFRPAWQYAHINQLHNVVMVDGASKEIARRVRAVITISGSIGMESLVLKKPVVIMGKTFFDFFEYLHKPFCFDELSDILHSILVNQSYPKGKDMELALERFLAAYLESLVPHYPLIQNANIWGRYLLVELVESGILASSEVLSS